MSIEFSTKQKCYMANNGLYISESDEGFTLHYGDDHTCKGLTESEVKYILDGYISVEYYSYKPKETLI